MTADTRGLPVVVLCGGRGMWIDGSGERRPKGLVQVDGSPMLLHSVRPYLAAGCDQFVLALGLHAHLFEEALREHAQAVREGERLRCRWQGFEFTAQPIRTGDDAMTGDRVRTVAPWLGDSDTFAVTYSDTLARVNVQQLMLFHRKHRKIATVLATRVPTRFRLLGLRFGEHVVRGFADKAVIRTEWINGGYFLFNRAVLDAPYLGDPRKSVLETDVLEALVENLELMAFPFQGEWQHLDSERDLQRLDQIASRGAPPRDA